jgi:hypothetical protein
VRILDKLFFEQRVQDVLGRCGFLGMLEGNRISEMFGCSASYGREYDVDLLRSIHTNEYPKLVSYGKRAGLDSQDAALDYVCNVFDRYLTEMKLGNPPDTFCLCVTLAIHTAKKQPGPKWVAILAGYRSSAARKRQETDARMHLIYAARATGQQRFQQLFDSLTQTKSQFELQAALDVWSVTPTEFATEWEIHQASGLALEIVVSWLRVFVACDLVATIGTALAEPKYRKSPIQPKAPGNKKIKDWLDTYASNPSF